jgi:hypothetical protein
MSTLSAHGISVELPSGWEGRIAQRDTTAPAAATAARVARVAEPSSTTGALLQAANFALPSSTGDFGSGAVEVMANPDLLIVLFEYDRPSASTPLFASRGIPRVTADDFSPVALQHVLKGQGGTQQFFNEAGRAMCLYVVLGSFARRVRTVPVINDLLSTVTIT